MSVFNVYKSGFSILCAFTLVGCGTTYSPPREPAPVLWQGKAGIVTVGKTVKTIPGRHEKHSHFAQIDVKNERTGKLLEDVTYISGPGITSTNNKLTLKAGTPLYARQFTHSVTVTTNYAGSSTTTQKASNNPIEWCAAAPDGKGSVCIFWKTPEQAFYIEDRRGSPLAPHFGTKTSGANGPVPKIDDGAEVSFDHKLVKALVVDFDKKYVRVRPILGSVSGEQFIAGSAIDRPDRRSRRYSEWDDNGESTISIWGGEFRFKALYGDKKKPIAVNVEVIKAPVPAATLGLTASQQQQLINMLIELSKAKKADPATP